MRRTERLFQIIQILRSSQTPKTGRALADELEISLRTLYRDMAELIAQRVPIIGEAGTGYVLSDGYDMPPLMLTADELEVAVLGAAWVASRGDPSLARSARDLVTKLMQAVPSELQPVILDAGLKPVSFRPVVLDTIDSGKLRRAIRERQKIVITYKTQSGQISTRVVWPLFLAYMEEVRLIVSWCEKRRDFRHFRTDRVQSLEDLPEKYPEHRATLLKRWKDVQSKSNSMSQKC